MIRLVLCAACAIFLVACQATAPQKGKPTTQDAEDRNESSADSTLEAKWLEKTIRELNATRPNAVFKKFFYNGNGYYGLFYARNGADERIIIYDSNGKLICPAPTSNGAKECEKIQSGGKGFKILWSGK